MPRAELADRSVVEPLLSDVAGWVEQRRESIDGVVFDAVGTLIRPAQPVVSTYYEFGRAHGSHRTPDQIGTRFRAAIRAASWQPSTPQQHRSAWRGIVAEVFCDVDDAQESLFQSLWRHYAQPTSWSLYEGTEELLRSMQGLGKQLAIASNFDDRLLGICAHFPAIAPCRPVLTATTLGVAKPSREFFDAVATRLGRAPRRLVMVGDDAQQDIAAARAAGWQAFQVRSASQPG